MTNPVIPSEARDLGSLRRDPDSLRWEPPRFFRQLPPLTPGFLLAAANAMVGQPSGSFVHDAGFLAHYDPEFERSSWPLPNATDPNVIADFAREHRILSAAKPMPGEIFLVRSPDPDDGSFVASGIVAYVHTASDRPDNAAGAEEPAAFDCATIEAGPVGTPSAGTELPADAVQVARVHRSRRTIRPPQGDRFVRWTDLDPRGSVSDPVGRAVAMCGPRCRWPHEIMSAAVESVLAREVGRHRAYIAQTAEMLSDGDSCLADELKAAALRKLWNLGLARLTTTPERLLRFTLVCAMKDARRAEGRMFGTWNVIDDLPPLPWRVECFAA